MYRSISNSKMVDDFEKTIDWLRGRRRGCHRRGFCEVRFDLLNDCRVFVNFLLKCVLLKSLLLSKRKKEEGYEWRAGRQVVGDPRLWNKDVAYIIVAASSLFLFARRSGLSKSLISLMRSLPTISFFFTLCLIFSELTNCCISSRSFSLFSFTSCDCLLFGWIGGRELCSFPQFISVQQESRKLVSVKETLSFSPPPPPPPLLLLKKGCSLTSLAPLTPSLSL